MTLYKEFYKGCFMMKENIMHRSRKEIIFLGAVILFFSATVWSCAQKNQLTNFNEALTKASENDMFVVLDVSASW